MRLFTYKPITSLLNSSVSNSFSDNRNNGFTVISISKYLSLTEDVIVAKKGQQKGIGFLYFIEFTNNILQYILVGRDKSVVTKSKLVIPTISFLQGCCD